MALVYLSGPWENILALWQYFKNILFQIINETDLTTDLLPNQSNIRFPNTAGAIKPEAKNFYFFEVLRRGARCCIYKSYQILVKLISGPLKYTNAPETYH